MLSGRHVVVIGGGASGAIMAAHLLRDRATGCHVTIIDPSERLGHGLAYGTSSPSHLLNARARSMSAFDDCHTHFTDWLGRRFGGTDWSDRYIQRRHYGQYIEHLLSPVGAGRLTHIRAAAVDCSEQSEAVRIDLDNGGLVVGHAAILAIGHGLRPRPANRRIAPEGDVLILGTGLGMVDEVLSLQEAGYRGRITALSRRGQLPRGHGARNEMRLDAADIPFGTHLSHLMRWLRAEIRAGAPWQDLIDALRPHVPDIWRNLPPEARRRFLRHARPWWDGHRHRMAPEVALQIAAARAEGRLEVVAGRIVEHNAVPDGVTVVWNRRGAAPRLVRRSFAEIVECIGPRQGPVVRDRLIGAMIRSGATRPDGLGIGIELSVDLRLLGPRMRTSRRVFAIGPITCPLAWETYAIPEIRAQCARAAAAIAAGWMDGVASPRPAQRYAVRP